MAETKGSSLTARTWWPLAVLIVGSAALGFTPIFVRLAGTGPAAAGVWRLIFAVPMLLLILPFAKPGRDLFRPSPILLLAAVFFAADLGFWHYGVKFTSVANSTTLANLAQIFVVAGAWILFRERPRPLFMAGLALALGGVWAMAAAKGAGGQGSSPALGDLLSIMAAAWYASYILIVHRERGGQTALGVMLWTSIVAAPTMLLGAVLLHERLIPATAAGWWACAGLGLAHVLGQGAIAWALGRLPAATASVAILVQPVSSAVLGWVLLGEALVPLQMAGAAAALGGVILAQVAAAKARLRETPA